jgi:replicative DNA helicase
MADDQIKNLKLPPHSIEAEQSLLGGLLIDNSALDQVGDTISSKDFYRQDHRLIFIHINDLINSSNPADVVTVAESLEKNSELASIGGISYLGSLAENMPSVANIRGYAKIIRDNSILRNLITVGSEIVEGAFLPQGKDAQQLLDEMEAKLFSIAEAQSNRLGYKDFQKVIADVVRNLEERGQNPETVTGISTGFVDLDNLTTGLHGGELVIIAGRPSMGKTALATNIAFNAAQKLQEKGKKSAVAFFSLEMSSEQLSTRILAEQSRIKSNDIRRGRISDEQFDKFIETSKNISELPLYIDETPAISIAAMSNRARRIKRLFGLDLIVVDYIQLMRGSGNNRDGRVQEISEITQGLKAMAKELKLPVIALSQLSRAVEQRDDHKPQLSDLRESGSIEQDADVVMFVYREAYYLERKEPRPATVEHAEWQAKMNEVSNLAELIIGKQRHGPTGNVMVEFEAMFTKFKDTQIN